MNVTPAGALSTLCERFWAFEREEQPFGAFLAGQAGRTVRLFREAPADYDRRTEVARAMRADLLAIPSDGFWGQEAATWRLLDHELDGIVRFHAIEAHLRPSLLPVGPEFSTLFYAGQVTIGDVAAARLHADRVAEFPGFLDDIAACITTGLERGYTYPHVVLAAAVPNIRRTATMAVENTPWMRAFARSPVGNDPDVRVEAERTRGVVRDSLLPAFARYADFLAGPVAAAARSSIACTDAPDGDAYYAALVTRFTSTDMSAAAVHELGLSEVARLERETATLAVEAGFADTGAYRAYLMSEPAFVAPSAEVLREKVEVLAKRIDARIPAFFGRIPRITYGIDSMTPAMSETMPPAYAQPAPSGGDSAGVFWITGLPERLRTYMLPSFTMHEAWPGHLMHIGLMAELDDLPDFRRYGAVKYTACIEGWALYCERLGTEFGIYRTPHEHYGRLEGEMWRACRLVLDTGIHAFGWTRERAVSYMIDRLTLPLATVEAEVDRYIALPGQALAYQIGALKFIELRKRAEARLGARFSRRDFHVAVMTAGAVTLPVLDMLVDDWLASSDAADA